MKRILVVGDILIDRYNYVKTERNAPEAKIPVWDSDRIEYRPGGAANVAANARSIASSLMPRDVSVTLFGIADRSLDPDHSWLSKLSSNCILTSFITGGRSLVKERFVSDGSIIFRHDNMKQFDRFDVEYFEKITCGYEFKQKFDVVIFSDYDKGTLTKKVVDHCRSISSMSVVDSKKLDLSMYYGCDILKLNELEYSNQVDQQRRLDLCIPIEAQFKNVVVTRGAKGAQLRQCPRESWKTDRDVFVYSTHVEEFPSLKVHQVDVTGCGDTHTAAMAVSMLNDGDMRRAVKFANERAAQVVQKFGTSVAE